MEIAIENNTTIDEKTASLYKLATILALITIFYNIIEGGVSVFFGLEDETLSLFGFGVDSCQDYLYSEIVASMTKRVDIAVYEMIKAVIDGNFVGGTYVKGVADGWTGCSRLPEEEEFWEETFNFEETPLDAAVLSKLIEAKEGIIDGTITVPSV